MKELYDIINDKGERIGWVNENLLLRIKKQKDLIFDNIEELLINIEKQNLTLKDKQGCIYNLAIHKSFVENVKKLGIGYIIK